MGSMLSSADFVTVDIRGATEWVREKRVTKQKGWEKEETVQGRLVSTIVLGALG